MQPNEKRQRAIAESIADLCAGMITDKIIGDVENDAAESDQGESDKPVMAKLAFSVQWPAGAQKAEIEAKLAWSVRRVTTADCVVDPDQITIPFEQGGES